jgi:hypothetical protein
MQAITREASGVIRLGEGCLLPIASGYSSL